MFVSGQRAEKARLPNRKSDFPVPPRPYAGLRVESRTASSGASLR